MNMFQKAVKHDAKLRMTINGPAGSGKTYTALLFASELGDKVAVVDTEHGSASKYADLWGFDVLELDSFHPQKYVDAIKAAEEAGYDVVVLDSLTHAWSGTDGLLDEVQKITKRQRTQNSYTAWADATPIQNKLVDTIIAANLHVIGTMRTKQDYILETNSKGKQSPKKVGMAPVQREGMEYEFDIVADMDINNVMVISKTRCPALSGGVYDPPDGSVIGVIKAWLSGNGPAPEKPVTTEQPGTGSDNMDYSAPVVTQEPEPKLPTRDQCMTRIGVWRDKAQALGMKRWGDDFHYNGHIKKHYKKTEDEMTVPELVKMGKLMAEEVTAEEEKQSSEHILPEEVVT